jgi:hypothetical protein
MTSRRGGLVYLTKTSSKQKIEYYMIQGKRKTVPKLEVKRKKETRKSKRAKQKHPKTELVERKASNTQIDKFHVPIISKLRMLLEKERGNEFYRSLLQFSKKNVLTASQMELISNDFKTKIIIK